MTLEFSPDGQTLASGGVDGIRFWDVADTSRPRPLQVSLTGKGWQFAFVDEGETFITSFDTAIIQWDAVNLSSSASLGVVLDDSGDVQNAAFSSDGKTLALLTAANEVRFWDVSDTTAPYLSSSAPAPDGVMAGAYSSKGLLALADADNVVRLWQSTDTALSNPLSADIQGSGPLVFSPDGNWLAVGNIADESGVEVWDVSDPAAPQSLGQLPTAGRVRKLAVGLDNQTLAVSSDDFALWDITDPTIPDLLGESPVDVSVGAATFSSARSLLATLGIDGLHLWDMQDPAEPQKVGTLMEIVTVFSSAHDLVFSPDGNTLVVTGVGEGDLQLWDVSDPANPRQLGPPLRRGAFNGAVVNPNGQSLVSFFYENTAILQPVSPELLLTRACALAGRNLTQAEWNRYVGEALTYHATCAQWPNGE